MTTYTAISNASVAVGAIPSSTTVTALRDNPIAIAEASAGAPVSVAGWHPVDKVTVGDGKRGLIYDFAVNGAVASVVSPDFVDGYEYRFVAIDVSGASTAALYFEVFKQTAAAYVLAIAQGSAAASAKSGLDVTFNMPRLDSSWHSGAYNSWQDGAFDSGTLWTAYNVTNQKLLRARFRYTTGNIDGGKIWMFRRREFASAD